MSTPRSGRRSSTSSGQSSGHGMSARGRHDRHTSTACTTCRRRKVRCDPNRPKTGPCTTCNLASLECTWPSEQDGRKAPTAEQYNAVRRHRDELQKELDALRHFLQAQGMSAPLLSPPQIEDPLQITTMKGHFRSVSDPVPTASTVTPWELLASPSPTSPGYSPQFGPYLSVPARRRSGQAGDDHTYSSAVSDTEDADLSFMERSRFSSERSSLSYSSSSSVPPVVTLSPDTSLSPNSLYARHDLGDEAACTCEWDRHLPAEIMAQDPPFTRREHDDLLNAFFAYSAPWNLRVVQDSFLADMRSALHPGNDAVALPHYSGGLHNIILAEALAFAPTDSWLRAPGVRDAFLRAAIVMAGSGSPIAVVQTHAAISHFYMGLRGEKEAALMWLREAVKKANEAGLCHPLRNDALVNERRDHSWCYYTTAIQDIQVAVVLNTNPVIPQHPAHIPMVEPIGSDGALCQLFIRAVHLSRIASAVLHALSYPTTLSAADIAGLHAQLMTWSEHLPLDLHFSQKKNGNGPHVLVLHIVHRWYIVHLNARFAADNRDCRKHAQDAVGKIVRMLALYKAGCVLARAPLVLAQATYAAARAALELGAMAAMPNKQRTIALANAEFCIQTLSEIGGTWECALEYAETLQAALADSQSRSTFTASEAVGTADLATFSLDLSPVSPNSIFSPQTSLSSASPVFADSQATYWSPNNSVTIQSAVSFADVPGHPMDGLEEGYAKEDYLTNFDYADVTNHHQPINVSSGGGLMGQYWP